MTLKDESQIPLDGKFTNKEYGHHAWGHRIEFHWIPLNEVKNLTVYPTQVAALLTQLDEGVQHFVYREDK